MRFAGIAYAARDFLSLAESIASISRPLTPDCSTRLRVDEHQCCPAEPGECRFDCVFGLSREPTADAAVDETERNATVMVIDLKTGKRSLLLNPKDWAHNAVWSVDGVWLYFTKQEVPRRFAIWRMRADGSGLERVAAGTQPVVAE